MGIAKLQAFMIGFTVLVFSCNRDKKMKAEPGQLQWENLHCLERKILG